MYRHCQSSREENSLTWPLGHVVEGQAEVGPCGGWKPSFVL